MFGVRLFEMLLKNGVIGLPSGELGTVLSFSPALNIDWGDLVEATGVIEDCLSGLSRE